MSDIRVLIESVSLCTKHPGEPQNIGIKGVALNIRRLHPNPENIIRQPALKLAGYPEIVQGNNNTGTTRDTTKYNNDVIVINE